MPEENRVYISYLLRIWEANDKGKRIWRSSLERTDTGERRGFATLQDLFAFLEMQTRTIEQQGEFSSET